jgi:hypothetical protein
MHVQTVKQKQEHHKLNKEVQSLKGLWRAHGPSFYKSMNKGYAGFGVKAILKERQHNTLEFIAPNTERDKKLFKGVHTSDFIDLKEPQTKLTFLGKDASTNGAMILENRDQYIQFVKQACGFNSSNSRELMQTQCTLMKSLYENKGILILTTD